MIKNIVRKTVSSVRAAILYATKSRFWIWSKNLLSTSVFFVCATSVLLTFVAALLSDAFTVSFGYAVLWFFIVCMIFHFILWGNRKATTQNQLRALEYVYIVIGLVGALGVVEVKSSFIETEMKLSRGAGWGDRTDYCVAHDLEPERVKLTQAQNLKCKFEREANSLTNPYNHAGLRNLLDRAHDYFATHASEEEKTLIKPLADYLESTWERMDVIYKKYGLEMSVPDEFKKLISDSNWLRLRIAGFYMLLIGVAIKFAKTTAEIKGWLVK